MKNKFVLALVPALLFLSACDTSFPSLSSIASSQNSSSDSQTSISTEISTSLSTGPSTSVNSNSSSSSPSSSSLSSSSSPSSSSPSSSSSTSTQPQTAWTSEQIALMKEHLGGNVIPFVQMDGILVEFDSEYSCISVTGSTPADPLNAYNTVLTQAGFDSKIVQDATYGDYVDGVFFDSAYGLLEAQAYEASETSFEIDAYFTVASTAWPEQGVATFLTSIKATSAVASFAAPAYQVIDDTTNGFYQIMALGKASVAETEEVYTAALQALGYTIDNSDYANSGIKATSGSGDVIINYYFESGIFQIVIQAGQVPLGDLTFTFADERQISGAKSDTLTTWVAGNYTLTVAKGKSTTGVGNTNYFSNPLRVYTSQVITVSWSAGAVANTITFICDVSGKTVEGLTKAALTNATLASSTTDQVVYSPTAGVTSITITASAQVRLTGAIIA